MKKKALKLLSVLLALTLLCSCSGRSSSSSERPTLSTDFSPKSYSFNASPLPSEDITLSEQGLNELLGFLTDMETDYPYADMYGLSEVKSRLDFDPSVETHSYCAADSSGRLTAEHLASLVTQNNKEFMSGKPFGYKEAEADYILDICRFIVKVTEEMLTKYPDMDKGRIYCNLGNLKILYDTGMLSYAEVSQDMVLSISKNNTSILLNLKGKDGFSRVMTHEIMHILQIGCTCESIENCGRRAGICVYWDDFTLNTTDWTWMVEGSAERNMCSLTGGDAVTYQYKMDYLCSMTLSVLLRDPVKADTMETLCFYSDPELLFDAFGCETEEERDELLKMMITLQVLQIQPKSFHAAYTEKTGVDLFADEEAMNSFSYSLKPAVCLSLSKEFYENLGRYLNENGSSLNDIFFLINLFEGQLDQHLRYTDPDRDEINEPFINGYTAIREKFFSLIGTEDPSADLSALYGQYDITAAGDGLYNADLSDLPKEKLSFLAERAQWLKGLSGLGQKVE